MTKSPISELLHLLTEDTHIHKPVTHILVQFSNTEIKTPSRYHYFIVKAQISLASLSQRALRHYFLTLLFKTWSEVQMDKKALLFFFLW